MPEIAQQIVRGFAGENRYLPADLVPPHVGVDGLNCDYSAGTIRKRDGHYRIGANSSMAGVGSVSGIFPLRYKTAGTWYTKILVSANTGWFLCSDGTTASLSQTHTSVAGLFDWCHFDDMLVLTNITDGCLKFHKGDLTKVRNLSIAQPATAPTMTTNGAGNLNGDYYYVVSYYNSVDVSESLASSPSLVISTTNNKVTVTIPVSTDAQVTARKLYRLDPGATSYRYLATVADNTTETYSDDTASVSVNETLNTDRGAPAAHAYCAQYANRVWLGNSIAYPSGVMYSEADSPSDIPATNLILVDPGDGDEVTGLVSAFGGLLIFKRSSIHFLSGSGPTTFNVDKIAGGAGAIPGHTIAVSPMGVYFHGHESVFFMSGPGEPQDIGISQRSVFQDIHRAYEHFSTAVYDEANHRYMLSFFTDASTKTMLVYHEPTQTWAKWDVGCDYLTYSPTILSTNDATVVFAKTAGNDLHQFVVARTNDWAAGANAAISWHWESPWLDFGDAAATKRLTKMNIWQNEKSGTITFKHKTDRSETYVSTTFSAADEFVQFVANNRGRKVKVYFENNTLSETADISAFQGLFVPRRNN